MSQPSRIRILFTAAATIFFTRAILFSTWQSRAPEVQSLLHLNTAQMGLLAMLYPIGGLIGLLNANYLNQRFGSRRVTVIGFGGAALAMAGLAVTIPTGNVLASIPLLLAMGFPMGVADFVGNFEGSDVDRQAPKSLLPAIHAVFGIGMMAGAGLASSLTANSVSLSVNYLIVAVIVALPSAWAGLTFPKRQATIEDQASKKAHQALTRKVWREPVTWMVASIGFIFAMAEISAGTWVPISLTMIGFNNASAAAAFGFFWIVITVGRSLGGFMVDRVGIRRTLMISGILTAAGLTMFVFNTSLHQPYLALTLWGLGMANGIPLAINAMSSDQPESPARINLIITVCYAGMLAVGPSLGAIGQLVGIQLAFVLPAALALGATFISRVIKR